MGFFFQWDRVEQTFANQFEADREKFRYRRWQKSAPIPVTAAERQQFIDQFHRRLQYASWGIIPATLLLIAALVEFGGPAQSNAADMEIGVGLAAILGPFVAFSFWAYTAPARALANRSPVGRARSRQEMRRLQLSKVSYGQLGGAAGAAWVMAYFYSHGHSMFSGWYLFWPGFAGTITIVAAVQSYRKWRSGRSGSAGPREDLGFPLSRE